MTRKILSLKGKRKSDPKSDDEVLKSDDEVLKSHDEVLKPLDDAQKNRPDDPRKRFLNGVAIHPSPCIRLELGSQHIAARAIDLITPIGMGQRALIVAPPGCGKTTLLKQVCQAVGKAYPEIELYALLIDERPEEVTDFKRSVPAQVHASSSDESYQQHVRVANELLSKATKEAGEGRDVMIVIDSLTRLSRVHNAEQKGGGRTMSGGLDARALEIPRKLFGAARKIENGGSLTILATILVDTGSQMDQVIFEEFKGTGNMEIVLSREAARQRVFPALDIAKSSTRREELLLDATELERVRSLRRALTNLKPVDGARKLVELLEQYPNNAELLSMVIERK